MLKEDVKIERWSSMRGLERTETPIAFRVSPAERLEIEKTAGENLVKTSDVIRASLIYAGVIPETVAEKNLGDSDGDTGTDPTDPADQESPTSAVPAI